MIRNVLPQDVGKIADIYNYYIENTVITFEEEKVQEAEFINRINGITDKGYPFIVYLENDKLLGYAYLNNWRSRPAYNITLETSVYVDNTAVSRGIGSLLYSRLIEEGKKIGIHSLIGSISLPNDMSRKLHQKFGFELIGNFKESGRKFEKYIDVEFWQLMLSSSI